MECHEAVFSRMLELLRESGLLSGKTPGVDSTTLEGNAAMRSIVRRDTGEGYDEFLEDLAGTVNLYANCWAGDVGFARFDFQFEVLAETDARGLDVVALNMSGAATTTDDLRRTWPEDAVLQQPRRGSIW